MIFLLFNIGLELSFERLQAIRSRLWTGSLPSRGYHDDRRVAWGERPGLDGPGATILAAAMSLSSTAVALQVLQDESLFEAWQSRL